MLKLPDYFARIGYSSSPRPDLETLAALHRLHPRAIPFENLSTLLGEPVPLDPEALQEKLVEQRRGGYCFEQNALFKAVLEAIGFEVLSLAARVVWNRTAGYENPRTHMVLVVVVAGRRYLADVGFGAVTLTAPLELVAGIEQTTPHETFRLVAQGDEYELEVGFAEGWRPTYRFDLQPQLPIDYEVLNHYVATHPSSHFRTRLMAGRPTVDARYTLGDNELTVYRGGAAIERLRLGTRAALTSALVEKFGIALPRGRRFDEALDRIAAAAPAE